MYMEMYSYAQRRVGWRMMARVSGAGVVAFSGALAAASGDLRLVEAVKNRDAAAAQVLLAQKVDVNIAQPDGATALHWAAYWDDLDTADRLLRAGAHVSAADEHGVTPLSLACTNQNVTMVQKLLKVGANPNATLVETGETVLMTCARTGSLDAVKALLAQGADVNATESVENQTALMWAVSQRHPAVARVLIEYGADVYARSRTRPWMVSRTFESRFREQNAKYGTDAVETKRGGYTPLLFAARVGDLESARLLLEAGADVDDTAPDGTSALVLAAHSRQGHVARFLLEQGADPLHAGSGYTALHAAVMTGDVELVKALLAKGADPNKQLWRATTVSRSGQILMLGDILLGVTPFHLAAKYVELEIMRLLVAHKADPTLYTDTVGCRYPARNCVLSGGWTPLMLAAGASWKGGADRRDRSQLYPEVYIDQANERGTLAAVKYLVEELGVDVDAVDATGNTALHHAAQTGFHSVVQVLADYAKLDVKNASGQTPLAIAKQGRRRDERVGDFSTAELLRKLGAPDGEGNK